MRSSILFAALSTLAITMALPTEAGSQLERRGTTTWGWITALYCETDEGYQTTTTSQCISGLGDGHLGYRITASDGCTFSAYTTSSDCTGEPRHVHSAPVCVVNTLITSLKIDC